MRVRKFFLLVLWALLCASTAAAAAEASKRVVTDVLLATVGNETISAEQLQIEAQIIARTGVWFAFEKPPAAITEQNVFEETMSRVLLYQTARKMGFGDVAATDVDDAVTAFRETFGDDNAYRAWLTKYQIADDAMPVGGAEQAEYYPLKRHFLRQMVIDQYLDKKITMQVKLGLDEYLTQNRARLQREHPQADNDELGRVAHRELFVQQLRELVADLRKHAKVVILSDRVKM
jgi:hypothetical protein